MITARQATHNAAQSVIGFPCCNFIYVTLSTEHFSLFGFLKEVNYG